MRLLLISDTHGKLDVVNELAARAQADAVIHGTANAGLKMV